jgi:hypothetical protein
MFEYTRVVFDQTIDDIKKLTRIAFFATQAIYVTYLIYAIVVQTGIIGVNIGLLIASAAYLVFSVIMEIKEIKKTDGKIKKNVKKIYKATKMVIQIPTLIVAIITLYTLENDHITFSLLLTVMMILGYVVSILLSLISKILETRINRFKIALDADMEFVMKIVNRARRFVGDEAVDISSDDKDGKIKAELKQEVDKIREVKKVDDAKKKQLRAENRARFAKEDKEKIKSFIKEKFEKSKEKIKSLTQNKIKSLPEPEAPKKEKETIEK